MNGAGRRYLQAAVLTVILLGTFLIYLRTMHPAFKNNDSPETTVVAETLAVGHPPGYPLFSMAGKIFTSALPGNHAFRMNLFSVFLALIVLAVTSALLNKTAGRRGFNAVIIVVLAVSYIFWNQAIEAKGGIYMMNLLFLSLLLCAAVDAMNSFSRRRIYFIAYVFGLSLSNHWPSMIILAPVFGALFIMNSRRIRVRGFVISLLLFILGLTPYLYLIIRAHAAPALNWGNPVDLQGLLWIVMRQAYTYPVDPSLKVYIYQSAEFAKLLWSNYTLAGLLALPGAWFLFRENRKHFYLFASVFAITAIMVVLYNRTSDEVIWLMHIFLMPAFYIMFLFIAAGYYGALRRIKAKKHRKVFIAAAAAALVLLAAMSFRHNRAERDFMSYDFGRGLEATVEKGGVYIGDGDYNLMPLFYLRELLDSRRDIIFTAATFLIFDWGINDFERQYGKVNMRQYETSANIDAIIEKYAADRPVYMSSYFTRADELKTSYHRAQKGLLIRFKPDKRPEPSYVYSLYSYRGVFKMAPGLRQTNKTLVTWYPVSMVNHANELSGYGRHDEALRLYKNALAFPVEKPEAFIRQNIAITYNKKADYLNELIWLERAVEHDADIGTAYERMGLIYYAFGMLQPAKRAFSMAAARGVKSEAGIRAMANIDALSIQEQYELGILRGSEAIESNEIEKAVKIYDFLLEKNYKRAIIYRNLGVYYFRTQDYDEAAKNFKLSNNETKDPEVYLYLAYTYYNGNMADNAETTLKEGLAIYPGHPALSDFMRKLKAEYHEETVNSTDRQRGSNKDK